jgi:hypothetical protein
MYTLLSDDFYDNPKVDAAGDAGAGVFAKALSYCGRHGTDGFVSTNAAKKLGVPETVDAVTAAQLWRPVTAGELVTVTGRRDTGHRARVDAQLVAPTDGYLIVDYVHFNPRRRNTTCSARRRARPAARAAKPVSKQTLKRMLKRTLKQ